MLSLKLSAPLVLTDFCFTLFPVFIYTAVMAANTTPFCNLENIHMVFGSNLLALHCNKIF